MPTPPKAGGRRGASSVWEFGRTYFPNYPPAEAAGFHKEWENIRLIPNEPVLLMAFRGRGKSTSFSLLAPIHSPHLRRMRRARAISMGQDPRGVRRPDYVRVDYLRSRGQKFAREFVEWVTWDLIPALMRRVHP